MSGIRQDRLSVAEVESFKRTGYLFPGKVIDDRTVDTLRALLEDIRLGKTAEGTVAFDLMERSGQLEKGSIPFYFNLWKTYPEFRAVALSPLLGRLSAQLLDTDSIFLLADNALVKPARRGGRMHWHQDYAAWPLGTPDVVTCWIALDEVTVDNGAMFFAEGSHLLGERLPVELTTGETLHSYSYLSNTASEPDKDNFRAALKPIQPPGELGLKVVPTILKPGECSFHHGLTWHASGANTTDRARPVFTGRYVKGGTSWEGERRALFYYRDNEAGIAPGDPIGGPNFPRVPLEVAPAPA